MSNFHHTAEIPSIRVEGHFLYSRVLKADGEHVPAQIDLDTCVGNDNGKYTNPKTQISGGTTKLTGKQDTSSGVVRVRPSPISPDTYIEVCKDADEDLITDFSETARDIRFHIEGENQPILRASLRQINGEWEDRDLNLTERILNQDGHLVFQQ